MRAAPDPAAEKVAGQLACNGDIRGPRNLSDIEFGSQRDRCAWLRGLPARSSDSVRWTAAAHSSPVARKKEIG